MYKYFIIGSGRQGQAIGYDLAKFCQAGEVLMADYDLALAKKGAGRINRLLKTRVATAVRADASKPDQLKKLFKGFDCVVSAVPYHFNYGLARAAVQAGASFCDLGGNTDVVMRELGLDRQARRAGVTVVPDTGLMPGMGNTLAVYLMDKLDKPQEVHIRCGGLPQKPKPPLNYMLVFSVEGLINEYFGQAYVIRKGKVVRIPTFSELEELDLPKPLGRCQAFVTSGGSSTAPLTLRGKLREYDYKTIRYPGHYEKLKALLDLGFFGQSPVSVRGVKVVPRQLSHVLLSKAIDFPGDKDLAVLRVTVSGNLKGKRAELCIDIVDFQDSRTGFTAMERTTGFPAAIVAHHLVRGLSPKGAVPLEKAIDPARFLADFKKRGIPFREYRVLR